MALNITLPEQTEAESVDIREKGKNKQGDSIALDRRLFIQLLAFGDCRDSAVLIDALEAADIQGVLYEEVNDPRGVGLLTFSESPDYFVTTVRQLVNNEPFASLTSKQAYTMFGRTYSIGYEHDLEHVLIHRPRQRVCNPEWPWAIWYPLRRSGQFEQLTPKEQRTILMEHGGIGRAYGRAGYGHDIRLACHGLDKNDNDFVTALVGQALYPLSRIVQRMRKTQQTSLYLERLGPFFIGKAVWQQQNQYE